MPSQEYPCPKCEKGLLLDAETAGMEVECPYCQAVVQMPAALPPSGDESAQPAKTKVTLPVRNRQLSLPLDAEDPDDPAASEGAAPDPPEHKASAKKNFPLHNTAAEVIPEPAPDEPRGGSSLPSGRERSRDEELRRLAAMAGNVEYDLEKFEKKGMIAFGCPMCHRPLWIPRKEAGAILVCDGCSLEIIAPRPELGLPARLADSQPEAPLAKLPKTVLPAARRVSDQTIAEGTPGGRPKRGVPTLKSRDEAEADAETSGGDSRVDGKKRGPKAPKMEPIPAKGDEVLSPTGVPAVLPTERKSLARVVGAEKAKRTEQPPAVIDIPKPAPKVAEPSEPRPKLLRLNEERRTFLPKTEADGDLEADIWGQTEQQQPVSRRFAIIGWLVIIPVLLALGFWTMRSVFKKKEEVPAKDRSALESQARIVHVAEGILKKFFEAKSVDEMARFVRHPEITLPRMRAFYKKPPPKFNVTSFTDTKEGALERVDFLTGMLSLEGEKPRPIALEIPPPGSPDRDDLRIDWESYVYWSETPWDEFLKQEIDRPREFRVVLQPDEYPNRPFEDVTRWVCFKLYHPDSFGRDYGYCFGYCELDSSVAAELVQPLRSARERGESSINCMVTLRFVPESKDRKNFVPQVLIEKFRPGWLIVNGE